MRHLTAALACALLLTPALARPALAQTADDVVNKHLAALGGREALSKITTRHATGTITINNGALEIPGHADLISKAPNKVHSVLDLDLSAMGAGAMRIEQMFDGKTGYIANSLQGDSDMAGHQLENAGNNAFPSMLLKYKEMGITLEMLPKESINGQETVGIRATPKTGSPIRLYFDATTYLLIRTVVAVDSPDGGSFDQTSDSSDYRTVDGVKVAFHVVNTTPAQTVTVQLDKVEHNVPIDDAIFVKK